MTVNKINQVVAMGILNLDAKCINDFDIHVFAQEITIQQNVGALVSKVLGTQYLCPARIGPKNKKNKKIK